MAGAVGSRYEANKGNLTAMQFHGQIGATVNGCLDQGERRVIYFPTPLMTSYVVIYRSDPYNSSAILTLCEVEILAEVG